MASSSCAPASKKSRSSSANSSVTCASSSSAKVFRDLENLTFVDVRDDLKGLKNYIPKYTLDDLAKCLGVEIEGSELLSDVYAQRLIVKLTDPSKYTCGLHPSFVFNGIDVDRLRPFYDTEHNKADVAVRLNTDERTNLVNIEVNSSPMSQTVCKVIHGLIQLLRVAKAHGVNVENDQLKLQGFAVPKRHVQGMVVKVSVAYSEKWMLFEATFCSCEMTSFRSELNSVIEFNLELYKACQSASFVESAKDVVFYLSPEEMSPFGRNYRQISANLGILFEAEFEDTMYCFKKPLLKSFYATLLKLTFYFKQADYRINYTLVDKELLQYKKVKYDPLSYTEANKCLLDLFHKVHKAIDNFFTDYGLQHGDLRLPNICFNDHFDVVLIDLDFARRSESICSDLICFATDLAQNIESLKEKPSMDEIMSKGNINKKQIEKDFGFTKPIKDVILERP